MGKLRGYGELGIITVTRSGPPFHERALIRCIQWTDNLEPAWIAMYAMLNYIIVQFNRSCL